MSFDKKEVQSKVEELLQYAREEFNDIDFNITPIIDKWLEAKRDFIEAWNGELIYQCPNKISICLTEHDKLKKVDEFIEWLKDTYICIPSEFIDFIYDNKSGFFENRVVKDYTYEIKLPHVFLSEVDIQEINVHKGDKLVKSFKYFFKDVYNKEYLRRIQDKASEIIQQDKITGYFCLSVHPLDFLSASENAENWDSCHRLQGEYAAGNLSYLLDKCTIISYLKTTEGNDVNIPSFPFDWNSKKWRMWLHFDENWKIVMAGREYPYSCSHLMNLALEMINKFTNKEWANWDNTYTTHDSAGNTLKDKYVTIKHELISFGNLVQDGACEELFYNDLTLSSYYTLPYYSYVDWPYTKIDNSVIKVGADVVCPHCGIRNLNSGECFICEDCLEESQTKATCAWCGERIYDGDEIFITAHAEEICLNCFENHSITCDHCGEIYPEDQVIYDDDREEYLCQDCKNYLDEIDKEKEE